MIIQIKNRSSFKHICYLLGIYKQSNCQIDNELKIFSKVSSNQEVHDVCKGSNQQTSVSNNLYTKTTFKTLQLKGFLLFSSNFSSLHSLNYLYVQQKIQKRTCNFIRAFGIVSRDIRLSDNKTVATKQVYISSKCPKNNVNRQISIVSKLNHPNIVQFIQVITEGNQCYIVMEYIQYDLLDFIEGTLYPLSFQLIAHLSKQILQALKYIHSLGIVHRDKKPSNILITANHQIKIGDFGSAIQGFSKWYMAPEMIFGYRKYQYQVDIWSAGCVIFEIILGTVLFQGNSQIQQIVLISQILGSPDPQNWKAIKKMPDYGKIIFKKLKRKKFNQIYTILSDQEVQLLEKMVRYQNWSSAKNLLSLDYFKRQYDKIKWKVHKKCRPKVGFSYMNIYKNVKK